MRKNFLKTTKNKFERRETKKNLSRRVTYQHASIMKRYFVSIKCKISNDSTVGEFVWSNYDIKFCGRKYLVLGYIEIMTIKLHAG